MKRIKQIKLIFNLSITQIPGERLRCFRVSDYQHACQHLRSVLPEICVIVTQYHHATREDESVESL